MQPLTAFVFAPDGQPNNMPAWPSLKIVSDTRQPRLFALTRNIMPRLAMAREHPPMEKLADEVVELRLIRVLKPDDVALRSPESRFLSGAPELRFAVHLRCNGLRVGRIHLRLTNDQDLRAALGHAGYAIDEAYRRKGYAVRAIRIVVGLARHYGVAPLWVLIEPKNAASRRAAERAGFSLAGIEEARPEAIGLGVGPRVCRYVIDPP